VGNEILSSFINMKRPSLSNAKMDRQDRLYASRRGTWIWGYYSKGLGVCSM